MTNFYIKSGENKALMAFAFTLEPSFHNDQKECTRLSWSPEVNSILENMLNRARENSKKKYLQLPYSALRFDIEATASGLLSVVNDIGLKYFSHDPKPFLVADNNSITQQVNDSFNLWTTSDELAKFCTKYEVNPQLLDRLDQLYTQDKLLNLTQEMINPFDWQKAYKNYHNNEEIQRLFGDLSSALLKALSGIVIHPKLGKLLPIISRYRNNTVALMTKPLMMEKGEFSLRLKLSVETLPSYNKPIITVTFTRSRWLDNKMKFLDDYESWYNKNITGYVHDWGNSGRCIAFELVKNRDSGKYEFSDDVYSRISECCNLPPNGTVKDLNAHKLSSDKAVARAIFTNQMRKPDDKILEHGFTTADRVIFYDAILEALSKIGVIPWTDWTEIRAKKVKKPTRSMVDLQAFLEGFTEDYEEIEEDKITPEILKEKLRKALSFEVEEISDKLKVGNSKINKIEEVQKINMSAISHFGTLMPTLVVIGENRKRREIITEMAKLIFGERVKVYQVNLPNHAYGTKPKSLKQKEHLKAQVEIWSDTIHQIKKACSMPIFALVEAPRWFQSSDGKQQKDYPLNKVATKKALANESIAVQYLLPPKTTKGKIKLGEYLMRIQNALYDLLFAQSGYAEAVSESINALFSQERKPRYVVGLSVISKNKTRFENYRKLIAAIRYDAYTGDSYIKYSYWEDKSSKISDWLPFTEGLFSISRLSEHTLGSKAQDIGNSIVAFCYNIIEDTAKIDPNAIIIVNPTHINSRYAWNWLQDKNMLKDISIGKKRFKKSTWKGIRIIRCRTDMPPGICQRKELIYQEIDTAGNENTKKTVTIQSHTNVERLLKVNNTPKPIFLSVAAPSNKVKDKRGSSVFEKRKLANREKSKLRGKTIYTFSEVDIMAKPASAPKTVEFAIAHKHPDDSDETLVRFVESLRFGYAQYQEWTSLPFVLHAMHTIEEYVSTFELEEDNEETNNLSE